MSTTCKTLLVHYLYFILDTSNRTMSLTTSIYSTVCEEFDGSSWLTTKATIMSIFWWEIFLGNTISITFTWCINYFVVLNTFCFLFPYNFLLINSISFSFEPWIFCSLPSFLWVSNYLLSYLRMLWMLVILCQVKLKLWKTLIMYMTK